MEAALKEKEASEVELKQKVTQLTGALQRTVSWLVWVECDCLQTRTFDHTQELYICDAHTRIHAHTHMYMYMIAHPLPYMVVLCPYAERESCHSPESGREQD